MGRLSTHVLDIARGKPAGGVAVELFRLGPNEARQSVASAVTNADGRTDQPLLSGAQFQPGCYELVFQIGAYFRAIGPDTAGDFLDIVPLRVTLADPDGHYHVPLLCSPWSYSTYRGS